MREERTRSVGKELSGFAVLLAVLVLALSSLQGCASHPPLPPQAIELNRAGAQALAAGDFETAAARLALAIEYSPRFTEAWVNLGLLQLQRGEHEAARRTLRKARELNPNLPAPHHALGLWAEAQDDGPEAEKHYRAALKVDPGFAAARANLGRLLFRRAAYDEAREQFLRLTEAAPETIEGWVGLVESYLRLGREADADDALDRAQKKLGERAELIVLASRRLIRAGAFARAERALEPLAIDAKRGAPERASALGFLAVARLGKGELARAAQAAHEALALDARQEVALYVLGKIER